MITTKRLYSSGWLDGHGSLTAPASVEALGYYIQSDSETFCPVDKKLGFPECCYVSIAALISALGCLRGPSAVFRFVVTVIIDSINRVLATRSLSHVVDKIFNRCKPPVAHGYATASVVFVVLIRRLVTPVSHLVIRDVFRSKLSVASKAVCCFGKRRNFFVPAATRLSSAGFKVCGGNVALISTGANAVPFGSLSFVLGAVNNCKSGKDFSRKVVKFHFHHLEKITKDSLWQAVVKPLFGSYPSHISILHGGRLPC